MNSISNLTKLCMSIVQSLRVSCDFIVFINKVNLSEQLKNPLNTLKVQYSTLHVWSICDKNIFYHRVVNTKLMMDFEGLKAGWLVTNNAMTHYSRPKFIILIYSVAWNEFQIWRRVQLTQPTGYKCILTYRSESRNMRIISWSCKPTFATGSSFLLFFSPCTECQPSFLLFFSPCTECQPSFLLFFSPYLSTVQYLNCLLSSSSLPILVQCVNLLLSLSQHSISTFVSPLLLSLSQHRMSTFVSPLLLSFS